MKPRDLDRLHQILRHGDPAGDGREPDAAEARLRRAELLAAASASSHGRMPTRRAVLLPVGLAAASLLVIALGVGLRRRGDEATRPDDAGMRPATAATKAAMPRQLHFTTRGGTRIVWVIYPEEGGS